MITFNVFETLITFKVANQKGIFKLIQEQLEDNYRSILSDFVIDNFERIRSGAEDLARTNYCNDDKQEISLNEIYDMMRLSCKFSYEVERVLIGLEETIVLDNVCLIQKNYDLLTEITSKGKNVILINETYYRDNLIKMIFKKVCSALLNYEYISSFKTKKSKLTAALYHTIRFQKSEQFDTWIHYGTSNNEDKNIPKSLGIQIVTLWEPKLVEFEKELLKYKANMVYQKYIGSSKISRENSNSDNYFEVLGCTYGGGLYFPYVHWVIQKCQEEKIERLYFISRDGYILKKVADIIIKKKVLPIRTYYIYGSRKAWRMASFSENNCDIGKFLFNSSETEIRSVKDIAKIFQVPISFFESYICKEYIYDEHLSVEKYDMVRRLIINNKQLITDLINYNVNNRELLRKYIVQEIDFSDDKYAFVDLTGSGFTQECLAEVMYDMVKEPIKCFFQKVDWFINDTKCIFYSFIIGNYDNYKLIEALCRAPHPTVIGYKYEDGDAVPIFDNELSECSLEQIYSFIKGIEMFVNFHVDNNMVCNTEKMEVTLEYLKYLISEELDNLGEMDFQLTVVDDNKKKYAPKLTIEDIRLIYIKRDRTRHLIPLYNGKQYLENEPLSKYYAGNSFELSLKRSSDEIQQFVKVISMKPIAEYVPCKERLEQKFELISNISDIKELDQDCLICIDSKDIEGAWKVVKKCIESGIPSNLLYWTPNGIDG